MTCAADIVEHSPLFWEWIDSEAAMVGTDGCTWATGLYRRQCKRHDLAYRYAADPVDAFLYWRQGVMDYWRRAKPMTKAEADAQMRRGIWSDSPAGYLDPFAAVRSVVLKVIGRRAWNRHRAREREDSGGVHG